MLRSMSTTSTDSVSANVANIAEIYAAFGRGDVAFILDRIAPDCRWESWTNNRAQKEGLPIMQPRTGPAGVADFFGVVADLQMHEFHVLDLLGNERQVAAEVLIDFSISGGGRLRDEELHLWTLDEQGRVVRMRHYVDTLKHLAAFHGEDTTAN
jgi:uncharacterized protein